MTMNARSKTLLKVVGVNAAVMLALLVPVELVFGTWFRPLGFQDLKRFSIPVDTRFEFDPSSLYGAAGAPVAHYTRDAWGLRGDYGTPDAVEVLTVGGSTTEQRYLDDGATWQMALEARRRELGASLRVANAGVDGQSTVGHIFNFDFWFPNVTALRPRIILFYLGANDVLRHQQRGEFDATVDATSWRFRSAVYQLLRTVKNNFRARSVGVFHGRRRPLTEADYTEQGLLTAAQRDGVIATINANFLHNVEILRQRATAMGAVPVFVTQTALAWNGDATSAPRGLRETIAIHDVTVNYADVSMFHQALNRALRDYCTQQRVAFVDLASEVSFGPDDYYDYLHNTPSGAARIGRHLADALQRLDLPSRPAGLSHAAP